MIVEMESNLTGKGGLSEAAEKPTTNLSDVSLFILRSMMIGVAGTEFFSSEKKEIHANDIVIQDSTTGRSFSFTLTAKEI